MKRVSLTDNIKLKNKLFLMAIIPMIIMGIVISVFFTDTYIKTSVTQTEEDLYSTVSTTLASYEINSTGKYYYSSNANLWRGKYNMSRSNNLLDKIKERTGIDITIISKDVTEDDVVITTAVHEDTGENKEIVIDESIKETLFDSSESINEVFSDKFYVDGEAQYFYAVPLLQEKTEEVMGVLIASIGKDARLDNSYGTMKMIILITVIVIVVAAIFIMFAVSNITNGFKKGFVILEKISKGKLNTDVSKLNLYRKDEIGDMYRSVCDLRNNLRKIISDNIDMTENIGGNVKELDETANAAKNSVGIIDKAIVMMNDAAYTQSSIATRVYQDIATLGKMIEESYINLQDMNVSNMELRNSNMVATRVVSELSNIKQVLNNVIDVINVQTKDTYNLTKEIKKYAQMIIEFAEETNLLALNATIEAARVGEKGKGFAIVANQIQNLADQSNVVSNDISRTINLLVEDTKKSVNTMGQVTDVVEKLNENIEDTKEIFEVVNVSVDNSLDGLKNIENKAAIMDETRVSISEIVKELDDVIQANKKTVADTEEVTGYIGKLFNQTNNIKKASDMLIEGVKIFEV